MSQLFTVALVYILLFLMVLIGAFDHGEYIKLHILIGIAIALKGLLDFSVSLVKLCILDPVIKISAFLTSCRIVVAFQRCPNLFRSKAVVASSPIGSPPTNIPVAPAFIISPLKYIPTNVSLEGKDSIPADSLETMPKSIQGVIVRKSGNRNNTVPHISAEQIMEGKAKLRSVSNSGVLSNLTGQEPRFERTAANTRPHPVITAQSILEAKFKLRAPREHATISVSFQKNLEEYFLGKSDETNIVETAP